MKKAPDLSQALDLEIIAVFAVLFILVIVAIYIVRMVRRSGTEDAAGAHSMLANFREMHEQGELSDEEYRTIKSELTRKLKEEHKDAG